MDVTSPSAVGATGNHLAASCSIIRTSVLADVAGRLGISLDRLRAELDAGKPLAHIAAAAGIALEGVADEPPPMTLQEAPRESTVDVRL